jgi:lactoylglutathione lyase
MQYHGARGLEARPAPRRFTLLTLWADEFEETIRFYRDLLGLDTSWTAGSSHAEFRHQGIRFAVYPREALATMMGVEAEGPHGLNGTFSLTIEFDDPAHVDAEHQRLKTLGVPFVYPPRDEPWGIRSAMLQDPDGNLIELVSWLPEAG